MIIRATHIGVWQAGGPGAWRSVKFWADLIDDVYSIQPTHHPPSNRRRTHAKLCQGARLP